MLRKDSYLYLFLKYIPSFNKICILALAFTLFLPLFYGLYIQSSSFSHVCYLQNLCLDEAFAIINTSKNNTIPVAKDMNVTNAHFAPVTFILRGSDLDGDKLNYTIIIEPAVGSIERFDPPTGAVTYTPYPKGVNGDSFAYKVTDSEGHDSNVAVVNIRTQ